MPQRLPRFDAAREAAEWRDKLARILLEAKVDDEEVVANPRAAGGDPRRLRGIPVVGNRGVGGAVAGTDPLRALMAKENRNGRRRQR